MIEPDQQNNLPNPLSIPVPNNNLNPADASACVVSSDSKGPSNFHPFPSQKGEMPNRSESLDEEEVTSYGRRQKVLLEKKKPKL